MERVSDIATWRSLLARARKAGKTIGATPTMGAFHEGHLTLMRRARAENDLTVATVFVNPTQFNNIADFDRYPRDIERDAALAEGESVDVLLTPVPEEIYPSGFDTVVVVRALSERLEGASRPGHFTGVATVVAKLLGITGADRAYFGEKDWQQLQIVRRLAQDLNLSTEIVGVPTVREADGLAMSSRNVLLSPEQRRAAKILSSALSDIQAIADTGVTDAYELAAWLKQTIAVQPIAKVDYAVIVDPETLQEIDTIDRGGRAMVAATFGAVRLIDNSAIHPSEHPGFRR